MKHTIIFFKNKICLYGTLITHPIHKHYLMQIVVSRKIFSNKISIEVIDSNVSHSMFIFRGVYFSIMLDPLSSNGIKLKNTLLNNKTRKFSIESSNTMIMEKISAALSVDDVQSISNDIIKILLKDRNEPRHIIDKRIKKAIQLIKQSKSLNMQVNEIYSKVGLSESHFNLLFKKDVGLPFRKYVLWNKLFRAVLSILNGCSYTVAAQDGDFFDSAHLARTFKENTGISISHIFKNKRFIQVHVEDLI
ncbi:MAG: helix-turn-helix transcriptional regulator [Spirochaetales bacterium]|nr:helix-turn-helix transcriptional regulator [Spirochaetales bacterium]